MRIHKKLLVTVAVASALGANLPAQAGGDATAGKAKAASCAGCHATSSPMNPNINGQPEAYLVSATKAYQTGERKDPTMKALVAALSDEDIANISAYFASLPCK